MSKFSIITVCYNEPLLERTCKSIAKQQFGDYEWIVIDGGSNQDTLDIFKKYEKYISAFVSEKDNGIYDAMNKGIRLAGGEFIIFMNAGDCFHDCEVLGDVADFISKNPKADIVYGMVQIDGSGEAYLKHGGCIQIIAQEKINYDFWREHNICHQTEFFRRGLFKKCGYYQNENYPVYSDWVGNLLFWRAGAKFAFFYRLIAKFDNTGLSSRQELRNKADKARLLSEYFPEYFGAWKNVPRLGCAYYRFLAFIFAPFKNLRRKLRGKYKSLGALVLQKTL